MTLEEDIEQEDLKKKYQIEETEDLVEKYEIKHVINPYEIPTPDYLFMLAKVRKISDRRA